jgi:hypothetical protein
VGIRGLAGPCTHILESIFNPSSVVVADAQTEVFEDRDEGLVAVFGTARWSKRGMYNKARGLTLPDDPSGAVRKDMSCQSCRSNCSGEGRRYT